MEITLDMHFQTNPWIAKIQGKDPKFKFSRDFLPKVKHLSKSGRSGYINFSIQEIGLYEIGGTKRDNGFFIAFEKKGEIVTRSVDFDRASAIVKLMDNGLSFEEARLKTKPQTA